jgi:hypothetical protein
VSLSTQIRRQKILSYSLPVVPSRRWLFGNRIHDACIPAHRGGETCPVTANIVKFHLVPHLETIALLGRRFLDFDAVDPGAVRPVTEQVRQTLY